MDPYKIETGNKQTQQKTVLSELDDQQLENLIVEALNEQKQRAIINSDPDACIKHGFENGFQKNGLPNRPYLLSGLVVLCGSQINKSQTSHTCAFAHVGEHWVWEHPDLLEDAIITLPGKKEQMRTVSLIPASEGLEFDIVTSNMSLGVHKLKKATSFAIKNGEIVVVSQRNKSYNPQH